MVPTLAIIHPDLPGAKMIINEADYDPTVHQLYGEESELTPTDEPSKRKRSPKQMSKGPEDLSPEQTPNPSEDQPPATPDLSQEQTPEPISDEPEDQPSPTPALSEEQSPEPISDLSEAHPPTYSQSDLEAKNITALRAIAAEKRIPRRMKLSRDELLQAILSTPTPPASPSLPAPSPANESPTTSFLTFDL
jgi:hypothetical protein